MINTTRFIFVYALLTMVILYIHFHSDISIPTNRVFSEFPVQVRNWRMISQAEFSDKVLVALKPTDYISRQYGSIDGSMVNLYLGYHGGGKDSGEIHSPKHCLPGSGWYEVSTGKTSVDVPGGKVGLIKAVYQKGDRSELFLYWFQVKGRSLTDEYSLKLAEITNSVMYRRRDSAFIRISVPFDTNEKKAMGTAISFLQDFYQEINDFLPR